MENNFENKIKELEVIVKELESGEVNLDDAIEKYTNAMKLVKECDEKKLYTLFESKYGKDVFAQKLSAETAKYFYDLLELNTPIVNYNGAWVHHPSDPNFPNHHPDPCVEENLIHLKEKIKELEQERFNVAEVPCSKCTPEESSLNEELQCIIENSIHKLPDEFRLAIVLREFQGLSYEEISEITQASIGTIKSITFPFLAFSPISPALTESASIATSSFFLIEPKSTFISVAAIIMKIVSKA